MDLLELQRHWDAFGKTDPLWAILTHPAKKDGKWELSEFFATGEADIDRLFRFIQAHHLPLRRGRALDFGCGVGRLTQALCRRFQLCCGVDIAPAMIERARGYNRYGDRCTYHLNPANALLFPDEQFDFICTLLVLQHMAPEYGLRYIAEFIRVLAPGGLLFFQMPSACAAPPPLPDAGFRARMAAQPTSLALRAREPFTVQVTVENSSPLPWKELKVGNHWLNEDGTTVALDDQRVQLPPVVAPGETCEVAFPLTAPARPGRYLLEFDVIQEFVAWFKDRGSQSVCVPCTVQPEAVPVGGVVKNLLGWFKKRAAAGHAAGPSRPQSSTAEGPAPLEAPRMEMYCTPREEITALVRRCGARMAACEPDESCGEEYTSYRYWVTK